MVSDVVKQAKAAQSLMKGWSVYGDWVAADAGGCTCHGAGPGHVPGCGEEPIGRISQDPLLGFAAASRTLVPELVAEIERLRPFSRCPGCGRTDTTIATLDEESPSIACSFCGYGT